MEFSFSLGFHIKNNFYGNVICSFSTYFAHTETFLNKTNINIYGSNYVIQ
jgi:hypothetical protein